MQFVAGEINMALWIGLFRGINVGGNNKMPMKELVKVLEAAGLIDVKTYIASGNMLFQSDLSEADLQTLIRDQVQTHFGFRPLVFLITRDHLAKVMNANPYKDHEHQGKAQHIFFLKAPATSVNYELLDSLKAESEAYAVTDEALYLYAPEGIGRSKMAEKLERAVKADMTARNLNTVMTLLDMAGA
jgi:uncharacterized protein (DUF1697 family)